MTTFVSWLGTIASVIGSFLVAFGIFDFGYIAFLIGSSAWLAVAIMRQDKALGVLNGTFFIANIIGVSRFVL